MQPRPDQAASPFSRRLHLLAGALFFIFAGAGAQQAYLVPYLQRITAWPRLHCSLVIATVYLTMMLFRVANLHLFRRWSDWRFTFAGSLTYTLFTLAMFGTAYVRSLPLAIGAAFVWGLGAALMWTGTAMQAMAMADAAGGRHGTGMGIVHAASHAGWLAGVLVLGLLYKSLSPARLPCLYLAAAGITLLGNVLLALLPAVPEVPRMLPTAAEIMALMGRARIMIASGLQFASALAFGLLLGVLGSYIEARYGAQWIWIAVAFYPATLMVMSLVSGHLTDRFGYAHVLAGGFLVGGAGLWFGTAWNHPLSMVLTILMLGLLASTVPVAAAAMVGDGADRSRRPFVYGLVFSWRDAGVASAAIGANVLGIRLDLNAVFLVFVAIFAVCALFSFRLGRLAEQQL